MNIFRKFLLFAVVFIFVFSFISGKSMAENWWEEDEGGSSVDQIKVDDDSHSASRINWEDGYIEVMAGGTVNQKETVNMAHAVSIATKTARHLAYEKLAETVKGISLTSNATYDRELMMDSNLNTEVDALIQGARVVSEEQKSFPDGSTWVEVILGLKLKGKDSLAGPTTKWVLKQGKVVTSRPVKKQDISVSSGKITGLIVDARGLGGGAAMMPKILSKSGAVIYNPKEIDEEYLKMMGAVGYAGSYDKARKSGRVGKNPLIVKAVGVSGEKKADIVIDDKDAGKIFGALKNGNFLKECRIILVLN